MKYSILLPLSFLFLSTCQKQEEPSIQIFYPGEQEFGWASGIRGDQQWEASGYWEPYPGDSTVISITFETYDEATVPQEIYGLNDIPLEIGTYTIQGDYSDTGNGFVGGTYVRLAPNGISVSRRLQINNDVNGFITISEYNSSTNTIAGSFEMFFVSEDSSELVEVTEGTFELMIPE